LLTSVSEHFVILSAIQKVKLELYKM